MMVYVHVGFVGAVYAKAEVGGHLLEEGAGKADHGVEGKAICDLLGLFPIHVSAGALGALEARIEPGCR